jgi:multidrug resistance efflux pump
MAWISYHRVASISKPRTGAWVGDQAKLPASGMPHEERNAATASIAPPEKPPKPPENLPAQREGKAAEVERARSRQIQALETERRLHQLSSRSANSAAELDRAVAERTIADAELERASAELRELDLRLRQENDRKQEGPAGRSPAIEARDRVALLSCRRDARAAEVKKAEAQAAFTLQTLRRAERLEKLAATPKEDLEKASDAHRIAEAELTAKKGLLAEAESQLSQARSKLRASEAAAR